MPLSAERLLRYGYDYEKLSLGPWHWHHRQPPQRVRQLAAQHLLATFFGWQQPMKAGPEPFYLAVWLVAGAGFVRSSQVVAGIGKRSTKYQNEFGPPNQAGPPLPPEYQQVNGATLLTWTTHPWETELDAFDYPDGWPAWALANPHRLYVHEDNSRHLLVQTGWIWVGQ